MPKYIPTKDHGTLFDKMVRLDELLEMGGALARLDALIDWAIFEPILSRLPISDADKAPDEKTIWAFREALNRAGLFDSLFAAFGQALEPMGMIARKTIERPWRNRPIWPFAVSPNMMS